LAELAEQDEELKTQAAALDRRRRELETSAAEWNEKLPLPKRVSNNCAPAWRADVPT
jgi:hypothetical protein